VSRSGIYREAIANASRPQFKEVVLQIDGIDLSKLGIGDASLYTPGPCHVRSTHAFATTSVY
jgi:hypothetical protein